VREALKAEEFIVFVNSSIPSDSGLRHVTREDLRRWTEMGFFKHAPEYYAEDRLTAIGLLRYERDWLSKPRDMPARCGKHRSQPSAGILQKGCAQVISCVGAYPENELIVSALKETNLISSAGIISVNCGFVSKKPVKPPEEGPRAASTGGELFVLQVEFGSSDMKVKSAVTPLGVKQFSEDDTLFRSLSNLNPDNKPVCIFETEGEIRSGEAINLPFPPEASGAEVKPMEPDERFSKSYFSTPFLILFVTIRGVRAAMVELTHVTHDRQRVPSLTGANVFPSRLYPLFLDVDADSMQSIVDFIATYGIDLQFRSASGNPQEDFRDEQRRMREILEKARERKLCDQDIERASTPHEGVMVEQSFLSSLVNDPHNADIVSATYEGGQYQGQFVPVRRFYSWLDFMWGELLADAVEKVLPRICCGCGACM